MPMIPRKAAAEASTATTTTTTASPAPAPASTPAPAPAASPAAAPAETATPASTTTTVAVAAPAAGALSVVMGRPVDVFEQQFKNRLQVDWNTLLRLQANNGNFLNMEKNKLAMGDMLVMQLLSYQDSYQISPGTDDAAGKDVVRYSNDGITTTKGENCLQYIEEAKAAGWTETKMTQRVTLVGVIESLPADRSGEGAKLVGEMFQIDLSATSRQMFDRFRIKTALLVGRGQLDPNSPNLPRLKCTASVKSQADRSWTLVEFVQAD